MAVLMLLAVASVFRKPHDMIFWSAVVFFVGHTAMAVRRYLVERKARTVATVLRHHRTQLPGDKVVFVPRPATSLLVPLTVTGKTLSQQTKNTL